MRRPLAFLFAVTTLVACHKHTQGPSLRPYRMGFASSAPRPDFNLAIQSLSLWTQRADAFIISTDVPWDSLAAGEDPIDYVSHNEVGLVSFCRGKGLKLWVYIDPENGLNRTTDDDQLVALGKSIAQPAMQQIYRRFVVVMDSLLKPDHLGLALETNLVRAAAPDSIYEGVRAATAGAAADVRSIDASVPLSVSVQVEVAWGKLLNTAYIGIGQDFTDFPFIQELGLSSYPYLSVASPSDLPLNYYSKLLAGHSLPVFVSEGGWTSASLTGFSGQPVPSSPAVQAAYIDRQAQLLTNAGGIGLLSLTFTDLDLAGWPVADSAGLVPFAYLGMVDTNFTPKPALLAWDSLFKVPLNP
jgi:hypothetical protein